MKNYVAYNKKTGEIQQTIVRYDTKNNPTLTEKQAKEWILAEIPLNKLPKGQIVGYYKVNIKKANKGIFELVDLGKQVRPIKLS